MDLNFSNINPADKKQIFPQKQKTKIVIIDKWYKCNDFLTNFNTFFIIFLMIYDEIYGNSSFFPLWRKIIKLIVSFLLLSVTFIQYRIKKSRIMPNNYNVKM